MAGFVFRVVRELARNSGPVAKQTIKMTVKAVPVVIKPAVQFTRAAATGTIKYVPIAGTQGARVATVTPFVRAGLQTRQLAVYVTKAAVVKTPLASVRVIKYVVRSTVRDAMLPYYSSVHLYQAVRLERLAKGASSLGERVIDRYIAVSGRQLNRVGLAPSLSGTFASVVRLTAYDLAIRGIQSAEDRINQGNAYVQSGLESYRALASRIIPAPAPVVVVPVDEGRAVAPPVVAYPATNPSPVVLPLPPVPTSRTGAPIVYTPPVGRR